MLVGVSEPAKQCGTAFFSATLVNFGKLCPQFQAVASSSIGAFMIETHAVEYFRVERAQLSEVAPLQ